MFWTMHMGYINMIPIYFECGIFWFVIDMVWCELISSSVGKKWIEAGKVGVVRMLFYNQIIYMYLFFFLQKVIRLNAMWYAGPVPRTEEQHYWKNWWNPNKVWSLVNNDVLILVSQFWQMHYGTMLTIGDIRQRVYRNSLYYHCNFSINLK